MRVLVTRAVEDADRTAKALAAAGHEAVLAPVLEIVGTGAEWPRGIVDAVLATSAHAFAMMESGPSAEAMRLMPLHLVGQRTAQSARSRGFTGDAAIAANAATLLARFGALAGPPRHLLYLAGRDRKPDIETALEMAGQALEVVEIYEARATMSLPQAALTQLRAMKVDAALHFSRRSAEIFLNLAQAECLNASRLRHLCLSDDVAAAFDVHLTPSIEIASAPTEPALLACLERHSGDQDA